MIAIFIFSHFIFVFLNVLHWVSSSVEITKKHRLYSDLLITLQLINTDSIMYHITVGFLFPTYKITVSESTV